MLNKWTGKGERNITRMEKNWMSYVLFLWCKWGGKL